MNRLACNTCRRLLTASLLQPGRSFTTISTSSIPSKEKSKSKSKRRKVSVDQWPGWNTVIGLELHVQLKGNVKLLSPSLAAYDSAINTHVSDTDASLPGSLPRLGSEPVRLALLACLALKSNINPSSTFDRKHYFYPDLPAGYQVTQKYSPLATGGIVRVRSTIDGVAKISKVRINQIQLEQDTAKSSHDAETGLTSIDLNRAGAALIEIVTEPDMRSAEDAAAFVRQLQAILRHIGASDANMDRGEMRCDVNVSVHRADSDTFGTRCEVKNLNGVRFLMAAIDSEVRRQIGELEAGGVIEQATRGFDEITNETFHLRGKADAPDYRYMPDPELGSIIVDQYLLDTLQASLPELPENAFDRLQSQYGLTPRDAGILVALGEGDASESEILSAGSGVRYFETVAIGRDSRTAANWVINELLGGLTKASLTFGKSTVSAEELGQLIDAVADGKVTGTVAKSLLKTVISSPHSATISTLISQNATNPKTTTDLAPLCQSIIEDFPSEVERIRSGQTKVIMKLVGEVMKRAGGKADAKKLTELLNNMITTTPA